MLADARRRSLAVATLVVITLMVAVVPSNAASAPITGDCEDGTVETGFGTCVKIEAEDTTTETSPGTSEESDSAAPKPAPVCTFSGQPLPSCVHDGKSWYSSHSQR